MHEHLSRELFRAIHKGWRNPGDLAAIAMAHLFELCPHCQYEFETWRAELGEGVARDEVDYDGVVQRIRERTAANDLGPEGEQARIESERREAHTRAEELLALPDEERLDWIRKEKPRHSGLHIAEALIEECRRKTPAHPREGLVLANLARLVLHHSPVTTFGMELFLRSLAHLANAVRVLGELPRADQLFADVRHLLRFHGAGGRQLRAEIDCLEASLRMDQFRHDEAITILLRAQMVQNLEKHQRGAAILTIKLARAHLKKAEFKRSLVLLQEAERLLAEEESLFLLRIVRQVRASVFSKLGDTSAARLELEEAFRTNFEDPLLTLRAQWLMTEIERHTGNLDAAEQGMIDVRGSFEVLGLEHEVALVNLDLARMYCAQARADEALDMAAEVEPVFSRLQIAAALVQILEIRQAAGGF